MLAGEGIDLKGILPLFLVLTVAGFAVAFARSALASRFSVKVQTEYKSLVAKKLYRLEYKYFDNNGSASVINKMNSDIAEADALLGNSMPFVCSCAA